MSLRKRAKAPATVAAWSVSDLSALYTQNISSLIAQARRILRSDADAVEVVQDTFLKFIDSVLGGALSAIKFCAITYLISTILVASPIALADKYISPSKSFTYADTHLPKVVKDLNQEVAQLFNKLT